MFLKIALSLVILCALHCAAPAIGSQPSDHRPNIVIILVDDMGFSDIGCYGGEIKTPNIDRLAENGIRFKQFYNVARCCPSRAALLTGVYPHQAQVGDMVDEYARKVRETLNSPAYTDRLNPHTPTIAEALRGSGYHTFMAGKWHLGYRTNEWPATRGFDRSFSVIEGAMNYYGFGIQHTGLITNPPMVLDKDLFIPPDHGFFATDSFTKYGVQFLRDHKKNSKPFFLYLAYTAPHWPLHARAETIAHYRGTYKKIGWDKLREQRLERLKQFGIIDADLPLAPRPSRVSPWNEASLEEQERWDEEMSIYAAQIEEMDRGVGQILKVLKETKKEKNTLVLFLSDNGGASEDPNRSLPGSRLSTRESYEGYGIQGAHVSSSPFRKTKKFMHEGGISTPLIAYWPEGIPRSRRGKLVDDVGHVIDLLPTCLSVAGVKFPAKWNNAPTIPVEGVDLSPAFFGQPLSRSGPLFWEHEGHRAIRDGNWKLVASHGEPWELYNLVDDRAELNNLARSRPELVQQLASIYDTWAKRVDVRPWPIPANPPAAKN